MSTMTVGFQVSGKTASDLEANADAAVKELAEGRDYTFEIGHVYGAFEPALDKAESDQPSKFSASVTAWLEGLPPSFRDERAARLVERW